MSLVVHAVDRVARTAGQLAVDLGDLEAVAGSEVTEVCRALAPEMIHLFELLDRLNRGHLSDLLLNRNHLSDLLDRLNREGQEGRPPDWYRFLDAQGGPHDE